MAAGRGVEAPEARADETSGIASRSSPPAPSSELPASSSSAPSEKRDEAARRLVGERRARRLVLLAPLALVGMALIDSLPGLFLGVAAGLSLAYAMHVSSRRTARRGAEDLGLLKTTPTPLGRAWLPFAWTIVLAAIFLGSAPLRLWACLLIACSVAAWPLARANLAPIVLSRRLPFRSRVGAPTSIEYVVENASSKATHALILRDGLGLLARPSIVEVVLDVVGARETICARATVQFERRGWKRLRPVRGSSRFPLGLFEVSWETAASASTLVRPQEGRATSALLALLRGFCPEPAQAQPARRGAEDFDGLREFRDGDDARRIHWRTTARRGVRTFVERRDAGTRRVLVFLGRSIGKGPEADRRFERAVSIAATVLRAAARSGTPARLVLGTKTEGAGISMRGRKGLENVLDALATVRGDDGRRPLAALASSRIARRAESVIWVSSGEEPTREHLAGRDVTCLAADSPELTRYVTGLP